jgi:hypothetical protein
MKRERERKRWRFVIFFIFSFFSVTIAYTYLLICTLLLFHYDGQRRGFFVQVYDRLAYVKRTPISLQSSDQLQIHTYILWHDRETLYYQSMWKRVRPLVILYVYMSINISIGLDTNLKLRSVNINQLSIRNTEKTRSQRFWGWDVLV